VHDLIELTLWAAMVTGLCYNVNDPIHKCVYTGLDPFTLRMG
jgi:hypothetical protein